LIPPCAPKFRCDTLRSIHGDRCVWFEIRCPWFERLEDHFEGIEVHSERRWLDHAAISQDQDDRSFWFAVAFAKLAHR